MRRFFRHGLDHFCNWIGRVYSSPATRFHVERCIPFKLYALASSEFIFMFSYIGIANNNTFG